MKRQPSFRNRGLQLTSKTTRNNEIRVTLDQMLINDYQKLRNSKNRHMGIIQYSTCSNNPVVMEYIRTIYQQYNIPDPMQNHKKDQQQVTLIKPRSSSFYLVNNSQEKHQKSRKSKKQETGRSFVRLDYSTPKKQDSTMVGNTTTYHPESSQSSRRILLGQNSMRGNSQSFKFFATPNITRPKHIKAFSIQQQTSKTLVKTKQSFRYCIACQKPILQVNIQSHQLQCQLFSKLYAMNLKDILSFLTQKINQIRKRLEQGKAIKNQDATKLSKNIQGVIQESLIILNSGVTNQQFNKNYRQAMDISSRWSHIAQQINKLRWFLKIRQNIKTYFGC